MFLEHKIICLIKCVLPGQKSNCTYMANFSWQEIIFTVKKCLRYILYRFCKSKVFRQNYHFGAKIRFLINFLLKILFEYRYPKSWACPSLYAGSKKLPDLHLSLCSWLLGESVSLANLYLFFVLLRVLWSKSNNI